MNTRSFVRTLLVPSPGQFVGTWALAIFTQAAGHFADVVRVLSSVSSIREQDFMDNLNNVMQLFGLLPKFGIFDVLIVGMIVGAGITGTALGVRYLRGMQEGARQIITEAVTSFCLWVLTLSLIGVTCFYNIPIWVSFADSVFTGSVKFPALVGAALGFVGLAANYYMIWMMSIVTLRRHLN